MYDQDALSVMQKNYHGCLEQYFIPVFSLVIFIYFLHDAFSVWNIFKKIQIGW